MELDSRATIAELKFADQSRAIVTLQGELRSRRTPLEEKNVEVEKDAQNSENITALEVQISPFKATVRTVTVAERRDRAHYEKTLTRLKS